MRSCMSPVAKVAGQLSVRKAACMPLVRVKSTMIHQVHRHCTRSCGRTLPVAGRLSGGLGSCTASLDASPVLLPPKVVPGSRAGCAPAGARAVSSLPFASIPAGKYVVTNRISGSLQLLCPTSSASVHALQSGRTLRFRSHLSPTFWFLCSSWTGTHRKHGQMVAQQAVFIFSYQQHMYAFFGNEQGSKLGNKSADKQAGAGSIGISKAPQPQAATCEHMPT